MLYMKLLTKIFLLAVCVTLLAACVVVAGYIIHNEWKPPVTTTTPTATPIPTINVSPVPTVDPSDDPVPTAPPNDERFWVLEDCGTDKSAYAPGDTAVVYVVLKNVQGDAMKSIDVNLTIYYKVGPLSIPLPKRTQTIPVDVQPGTTQRYEYAMSVPAEYNGMPVSGSFDIKAEVSSDGTYLGTKTLPIRIG
jgi:hypothetical protein